MEYIPVAADYILMSNNLDPLPNLQGFNYILKLSFWVLYLLPNLLFSILFLFLLTYVLKAEASLVSILLFYAATFAVIGYLSISMVGTWKSANYFRILVGNKASKLGIVAQIFVSADILLRIIGVTKQFI